MYDYVDRSSEALFFSKRCFLKPSVIVVLSSEGVSRMQHTGHKKWKCGFCFALGFVVVLEDLVGWLEGFVLSPVCPRIVCKHRAFLLNSSLTIPQSGFFGAAAH